MAILIVYLLWSENGFVVYCCWFASLCISANTAALPAPVHDAMLQPMKSLLFALSLAAGLQCAAQNERVNLLVQSPDGKTVKLLWLPNAHTELGNFEIRRKDALQDWVKINRMPIVPGISSRKRLFVVESDKTDVVKLWDKLTGMLKTKKLKETDNTFLKKLATDDVAVQDLTNIITHDYDMALIYGFGFVDHTVLRKTSYQYGVFLQGSNKPIATAAWNYGEIPDLNLVKEITSKSVPGKKSITITWNADISKMRGSYVTGFNIYRMGIRLNEIPIVATNPKDLTEFCWVDRGASSTTMYQYSISAESIIGLEGIIKPYIYDPAEHPREYKKAEVANVTPLGFYFKDGINIQWELPKGYDRFIKEMYVEKDNLPDGYKRISPILSPATHSFRDTTGSPVNSYIRFRVVTLYKDRTIVQGSDRLYNYFPVPAPPTPLGVKARGTMDDKKYTVSLTWDAPMRGDTVTSHYKVYVCEPMSTRFNLAAEKVPIKGGYRHIIQHGTASLYKFAVSSVNKQGVESPMSDTILAQVPSVELPTPAFNNTIVAGQNVELKWEYPEIPDVKGFRLFLNQQQIATENELKKNIRSFVTAKLEEGVPHSITIRAISESGVISEISAPTEVNIPKGRK
jgi:hypothetical protein